MATRTVSMTGEWVPAGAGQVVFSAIGSGTGVWQVQAADASASTLNAQQGHPVGAGETLVYDAGAETVYLRGSAGVAFSVT